MNRTQKAALYGLYLVAFMLLIPLVDLVDTKINPVFLRVIGYPLVILLVLPIWFLTKKKKTEVDMDERDKRIVKRALLASFILLAVMLGLTFVIAFFALGLKGIVSVTMDELSAVIYFVLVAFILVLSLAVLIQYGWGGKDGGK